MFNPPKKTKKPMRLLALLFAAFMLAALSSGASAQSTGAATGTVTDQTGEPLAGVSVLAIGTRNGCTTDIDGKFSLPGIKTGTTIRFSFVGCKPEDAKWNGTPLNIVLEDNVESLNEVVAVGFGTQKKVNLTGAVSTVSSEDLKDRPVTTAVDALMGLTPGLDIQGTSNGGALDGRRSMNIRGVGTIGVGSSVEPLVLVDGMESDLNLINPADIENISVLKDAAASSIYGTRAAGGVILVTTKSGKEGKITINYSDSFRWSHIMNTPHMVDSYTWANVMNQASIASGRGQYFPQEKLDQLKAYLENPEGPSMFVMPNATLWTTYRKNLYSPLGNVDWLYEHFGQTSFSQEHNVSITGGQGRVKYYFSGNLMDLDGQLRYGDDGRQRYTITSKINIEIAKWLHFGYTNRWARNQYDAPSDMTDRTWYNVSKNWPIIPIYDPNGFINIESQIPAFRDGGRYQTCDNRTDHQFSFLINPIQGLNINADFNYRTVSYTSSRSYLMIEGHYVDGTPYEIGIGGESPYGTEGSGIKNSYEGSNYFNPNIYAEYSHTFKEKHNMKVMAGFQSEWKHAKGFSADRNGLINTLPYLDTAAGGVIGVGGYSKTWSTAGWFGRINYDYDGRYLIEANIRYDGSSRFRRDHRWTWSPSVSAGWNIAKEKFFEGYAQTVNTLKLRASWGKLGNQNTSNWYPTYVQMPYYPDASEWLVGGEKPTFSQVPGLLSETLTWEKNRTWDIGFDWGLFNNRLTGSFDYYNRKTIDMVGPGPEVPDVLGTTAPTTNNVSMTSRGWELGITWRDRIGDFYYSVTGSLYDHTTTIDDYPNPNKSLNSKYYPGMKLGEIWGYESNGLARSKDQMNAHLDALDEAYTNFHGQAPSAPHRGQIALGNGWTAGDLMFVDQNGDGVINNGDNTANNPGDMKVIGNNTPRYCFGLTLEAQWKGFDLKVFFQGVGKRDHRPRSWSTFFGCSTIDEWHCTVYEPHLDYFRDVDTEDPLGPNVDAYYPRVFMDNGNGPQNHKANTTYLQNAAYCRLKNVTIGYTVPQSLTRKIFIEKARVFVSGENLATITKFTKMGDPELLDTYYATDLGIGRCYPLSKVFSCGVNITF